MLLRAQGDLAGAAPLLREALQVRRETLGNRHPNTLISIGNLGMLLRTQGDLEGAAPLLSEALQACRKTLGNLNPSTLNWISNLGILLMEQGETVEASALMRELQTSLDGASPPKHCWVSFSSWKRERLQAGAAAA